MRSLWRLLLKVLDLFTTERLKNTKTNGTTNFPGEVSVTLDAYTKRKENLLKFMQLEIWTKSQVFHVHQSMVLSETLSLKTKSEHVKLYCNFNFLNKIHHISSRFTSKINGCRIIKNKSRSILFFVD